MIFKNFTWSWVEMCGRGGLVVWNPTKDDTGACFQQLFLQIPVLSLFAIVSSYYYGSRSHLRSNTSYQKWIVRSRTLFSILLTLTSVLRTIVGFTYISNEFRMVDYLAAAVEIIAWTVHTGFVQSLRHRPKVHGPLLVRVLWILTFLLSILNLRSLVIDESETPNTVLIEFAIANVVFQVLYALTFFTFCCKSDNVYVDRHTQFSDRTPLLGSHYQGFREDFDPDDLGVGLQWNKVLSWLFFFWVNPLIKKGSERKIRTVHDLYDLPNGCDSSSLCVELQTAAYGAPYAAHHHPPKTLFKALHKCFGVTFYSLGVLKLFSDMAYFAGPVLLNRLVNFIESGDEDHSIGYILASLLFVSAFVGALSNVLFTFFMSLLGLRMRGAIVSIIYRKTLNMPYWAVNSFSMGEIVNFMSTDTDRIVNSCPSFHTFWSIPLQIAVSFYLLYQQVGISFLAGVAFTIVLIPINKLIANKIKYYSTEMMTLKDERVSTMSNVLRGIRFIKLHVWEEYFLKRVLLIRSEELDFLRKRKYLDALCVYFWASTPVIVSVLTLSTYSLLGNSLDAATVFTTLALLNMLIGPLNNFPWVLNGLVEAWVSLKRIQRLMDVPNMEPRNYYDISDDTIALEECWTDWKSQEINMAGFLAPSGLSHVTLSIGNGQLVGVIGNVGSGKTALLMSLLGEMFKSSGRISVISWEGGFGYVAQTPWLQYGTVRENILFGKRYISARYKAILDACCLTEDLTALHGGDLAKVGEGGVTLSGGQRARLALARAVYQDKDIYLIDDVLSALDPPVARHVYQKVICGLLKTKTRLFCTNSTQLLTNADLVVVMDKGEVVKSGKPSEVLPNFDSLATCDTESVESYKESREESEDVIRPNDEEASETGAVKGAIYRRYAAAVGPALTFFIFLFLLLMQATRNLSDYWLSWWVSMGNVSERTHQTNFYLMGYSVLGISNTFFTLFRAGFFAYGGVQAAQTIHKKVLKKVIRSKVTFFDISPLGRILNRFSSDTYTVDDSLPFITNILLAQMFGLFGSLIVTLYGMPWLCLLIVPLIPLYSHLQQSYRQCSRELKRLSSVTLSPLFGHINDTLQGLVTIRAFRSLTLFQQENDEFLDHYQRALYASNAVNGWLSLRLQMIGVALITGTAVVAVLQNQLEVMAPALVGLVMAYALSINSLLSGVITAFAETEREFVALERVVQYIDDIEQETNLGAQPPYAWPSQGVVSFQGVYMKYRSHLAPSLNGISFETRPAEKIGVVGRTGAGKSSLITALLRLVDLSSGVITIDTTDISQVMLTDLRSRIAVIPQDPYLFLCTIKGNVDPLGNYTEQEVTRALDKCHCRQFVEDMGGISTVIGDGGREMSMGQRQLVCLARAVLKNAKVVCIDEATASVDQETDRLIQQAIRSCFRQSTVFTIAHRISTIMDSDRLLVLRDGEVVEFDTPDNLVSDKNSYFHRLAQKTG